MAPLTRQVPNGAKKFEVIVSQNSRANNLVSVERVLYDFEALSELVVVNAHLNF